MGLPLAFGLVGTLACDPGSPAQADAASPHGTILPQPLATLGPEAGAGKGLDAGASRADAASVDAALPPPEPIRPGEAIAPERVGRFTSELSGVRLTGRWRWRDVPAPVKLDETDPAGMKAVQGATELGWGIELSATGRMRVTFESGALPLPEGAEVRQRNDRYGSIVLWPGSRRYRVVTPGAMRTTLGEHRVDVTPVAPGLEVEKLEDGKRVELTTRRVRLTSAVGNIVLDLARVPEAGRGAVLLCRLLVDIAGIHPSTPACIPSELAVAAEYEWTDGGGTAFEVLSVTHTGELSAKRLLVPPPGARHAMSGLPPGPKLILTPAQLSAMRAPPAEPAGPEAVAAKEGLVASNQSDSPLYMLLDGVPVVVVAPWSDELVLGPRPGRYSAQWRSFLGDVVEPAHEIEVPTRLTFGAIDAGAPDGGS